MSAGAIIAAKQNKYIRKSREAGAAFLLVLLAGVSGAGASELGGLAGQVRLTGATLPRPTPVENTTDPEHCGQGHTLEDLLVSAPDRGVRNVILSLNGVPPDKVPPVEPSRLVLDNVECRFVPHVAVLSVGSTVEAVNSDAFLHTAHLYGAAEMNIALPLRGSRGARLARTPGMIIVKCDVHAWMQAFIWVDSHPFHAVSDAEGRFQISNVPPGSYKLETWHERLGRRQRSVHIEPGKTLRIEIVYPDEKTQRNKRSRE